jgi:hypothetical protein
MTDLFRQSGSEIVVLAVILIIGGGSILGGAWALWLNHRRHERQDEMKRDMLERGMSADDIVRVLNAGPPPEIASTGSKTPPRA